MRKNDGNVLKVMNDAAKIVDRLRNMEISVGELLKEYHCSQITLVRAILTIISRKEYDYIKRKYFKMRIRAGVESRRGSVGSANSHVCKQTRTGKAKQVEQQHQAKAKQYWECIGCAAEYHEDRPPEKCPKCFRGSFELMNRRMVI